MVQLVPIDATGDPDVFICTVWLKFSLTTRYTPGHDMILPEMNMYLHGVVEVLTTRW